MTPLEEIGEPLHPLPRVGGREHRLGLLGKEAAHQSREPGVVVGESDERHQLPQRRRTPQERLGQAAQERRGCSFHRTASDRRRVELA